MKKTMILETRLMNVFEKLKPYMLENDDEKPTYFISFQNVLKIGINPSSKNISQYRPEPYGFYAVPLKYWNNLYEMLSDNDIQFPERKYLFLITFKPGSRVLYLDEFTKPVETWKRIIKRTRKKYPKAKNPSIALTKYLIDDMGIDVVVDNVGNVMTPIEEFQAVFLRPTAVNVIDIFELDPFEVKILINIYSNMEGKAENDLIYLLGKKYFKEAQIIAEALYGKEIAEMIIKTINSFIKDWNKFYPGWISGKDEFIEYILYNITNDENFENYDENTIQTILEEEYEELKETNNETKLGEFRKFIKKYKLDNIFEL